MAVDKTPPGRPDFEAREPGTGKPVMRKGAEAAESDVDVATQAEPYDLVANGDYESGQRDTGGAEALAGDVKSADGNSFSIEVDWLDDAGDVLSTHAPSALQSVTDASGADFNLIIKSDHFNVRITDESGLAQNNIHGSINAH